MRVVVSLVRIAGSCVRSDLDRYSSVISMRHVWLHRYEKGFVSGRKWRRATGTSVAKSRGVTRAVLLSLLLSGCVTNSKGRVNVTASTGVLGGVLIVGGAALGAGACQPSPEQCDKVERGDPVAAGALVIAGISLLALAVLFDRVE